LKKHVSGQVKTEDIRKKERKSMNDYGKIAYHSPVKKGGLS
jgi:hypothetical protein